MSQRNPDTKCRPCQVSFGFKVKDWHVQCSVDFERWYWEDFGVGYNLGKLRKKIPEIARREFQWKNYQTGETQPLRLDADGRVVAPFIEHQKE